MSKTTDRLHREVTELDLMILSAILILTFGFGMVAASCETRAIRDRVEALEARE